jgi:hypothetical protein
MTYPLAVNDRYVTATLGAGDTIVNLDYPVIAAGDVTVYRTRAAVRTLLVLDVDYAVSLLNQLPGARVTLAAPSLAADVIEVIGARPIARTADLNDGQKFSDDVLNAEFDNLTLQQQEARRDVDRSWKSAFGIAGGQIATGAAGQIPAYNVSGNLVPVTPDAFNAALVGLPAVTAAGDFLQRNAGNTAYEGRTAAQVRATLGVVPSIYSIETAEAGDYSGYSELIVNRWSNSSPLAPALYRNVGAGEPAHDFKFVSGGAWFEIDMPAVNSRMRGAVGDGNAANMTVDTVACQATIDYSGLTGVPIHEPAATYIIDGYKGAQPAWTSGQWAHGGLIVRGGATLLGSGRGVTIFKNGANNWRCVLRVREGQTSIRHLTADGDIANHANIELGPTSSTQGSIRGEGIIYEGQDATGLKIDVEDVEVKNTGHYGIGLQDVKILEGYIRQTYYSNIGGDCIDIKSYSAPDYSKALIIDGVFSRDGCGHNYVGGPGVSPHDNQAVVDIGGKCIVSNIFIEGLDSFGTQLGNTGVRLRAPLNSDNRLSAAGSTVQGVYVKSSKLASEGSISLKRINGVAVNCHDVEVADVIAEDCFWGVRCFNTEDGIPLRVRLNNILAKGCVGAGSDAVGIDISSVCQDIKATNLHADACEIGIRISGQRGVYMGLGATNNTVVGLSATDDVFLSNVIAGFTFAGNAANMNATTTPATISASFPGGTSVIGSRSIWHNILSRADDGSWTADNAWIGGVKYFTADTTGTPGEVGRSGMRSTGASGLAFEHAITIGGVNLWRIQLNQIIVRPELFPDFVDDIAAGAGGVPVSGLYRTGSALKMRLS